MLLSELLGVPVVTTAGEELGRVHDALIVQDGPLDAHANAGLRLHAIAVGRQSFGTRLGYVQGAVHGPWLLKRLFSRPPQLVPWSAIVQRGRDRIVVDSSRISDDT